MLEPLCLRLPLLLLLLVLLLLGGSSVLAGGGVTELQLLAALEPGASSDPTVLGSADLLWSAGLLSRLRGLTLATVGWSRACVGVSGGLAWCPCPRLAECWQTGAATGELRTRCTTTGDEGVSSERMAPPVGKRGPGTGELREEPEESEPSAEGTVSAATPLEGSGEGKTPSVANLQGRHRVSWYSKNRSMNFKKPMATIGLFLD